jgi:Xaa-Pro aminopeptidase
MRKAERATAAGFAAIVPLLEPGRTERQVQIELEAVFFRNGADFLAFGMGVRDAGEVLRDARSTSTRSRACA